VDGRGVPLSIVVTGANRHDVSQLAAVLDAVVVERPLPSERRSKHLCADAGYTGELALRIIEEHGHIPHVKGRGQEAKENRRHPTKRARPWIVEVAHSWFNRFRPPVDIGFAGSWLQNVVSRAADIVLTCVSIMV
jgi:IS5 family transposase